MLSKVDAQKFRRKSKHTMWKQF